jgi:DNA modification methylase
MERNQILQGPCLGHLKAFDESSIDCVVTDPPYSYTIRGARWDRQIPGVDVWKECLRVQKPGSFAFVMCSPRQDILARMIVNLQEAGFIMSFSPLYWAYASGFTRATNIERTLRKRPQVPERVASLAGAYGGYQPKTAVEVVLVAMKPSAKRNYVEEALTHRRGITWLDDGRIPYQDEADMKDPHRYKNSDGGWAVQQFHTPPQTNPSGRFPANLLVSDDALDEGKTRVNRGRSFSRYFDLDAWWTKRVQQLPPHVQKVLPFLIAPKPGKKERNAGSENTGGEDGRTGNTHETVKPLKLMAYLLTIGSRPGDLILDPFCGSGTTCVAAEMLGRHWVGIDQDAHHCRVARARVVHWKAKAQRGRTSRTGGPL